LKLKYGRTDKISEQEVVECARNPWTGALLGCRGGWDFSAYNHAKDRNGITYASTRPYRGVDYTGCTTANARVPGSRVSYYYDINQDEEWMKHYLFNNGPLYVSFYVSNDFYSYRSGIYTDSRRFCGTQYNNHAVLLVGYGTENGLNYWKLKNSWGTNWGENGFFRLRRKLQKF
jgi:C1A family cysteine protease